MTMVLERPNASVVAAESGVYSLLDISVAEIQTRLLGLKYPASKSNLISQAANNGATSDVITFLRLLPEVTYHDFSDITFMAWEFLVV